MDLVTALLNAAIVFTSESTLDVILNSLAIEFISQVDDQYKAFIITDSPLVKRNMVEEELRRWDGDDENENLHLTAVYLFAFGPCAALELGRIFWLSDSLASSGAHRDTRTHM